MIKKYIVTADKDGMRLCDLLREEGYSTSMLRRLIHGGGLTVNGEFHRNIDPVAVGDEIAVDFPDREPVLTPNGNLNITVAYEDENVLIFDKPDDILVHPATREFDDALGNYFAYLHPGIPFRPIGRLDRHTTGLCLIAKNKLSSVVLQQGIKKEYLAIVEGRLEEPQGQVKAPLIRVPGSTIMRKVDPEGQYAVTNYSVEKEFKDRTLVRLVLETGRTHQIRVHMAWLGHPLCGDTLYGGGTDLIERSALHCCKMQFSLEGEEHTVVSPLPPDMESLL